MTFYCSVHKLLHMYKITRNEPGIKKKQLFLWSITLKDESENLVCQLRRSPDLAAAGRSSCTGRIAWRKAPIGEASTRACGAVTVRIMGVVLPYCVWRPQRRPPPLRNTHTSCRYTCRRTASRITAQQWPEHCLVWGHQTPLNLNPV